MYIAAMGERPSSVHRVIQTGMVVNTLRRRKERHMPWKWPIGPSARKVRAH